MTTSAAMHSGLLTIWNHRPASPPFVDGLKESGWTDGRNVQFDFRFGTDIATTRKHAAEMIALAPEVILAQGSQAAGRCCM